MEQVSSKNTCKGVALYGNQSPPRIALIHNVADPLGPDGKEGKPEGNGLPGGGSEEGETPFETVLREIGDEAGIAIKYQVFEPQPGVLVKLPTILGPHEDGAFICEPKPWINNTVLTFLLEPVNNELGVVSEVNETGCGMFASLAYILLMPLAVNKEKTIKNPWGIYFADKQRIIATLHAAKKNFCELIPNLRELMFPKSEYAPRIKKEEVGDYIYDILYGALQAEGIARPLDRPTEEELIERYQPAVMQTPATDPDEEYRQWFEKSPTKTAV